MNNRQKKQPRKVIDIEAEFASFVKNTVPSENLPPQAKNFAEVAFLFGASMMANFFKAEGPKGSSGFVGPTSERILGRLRLLYEANQATIKAQQKAEQENAAFANADGENDQ